MSRTAMRGVVRTGGVIAASMGLLAAGAAIVGTAPAAMSAAAPAPGECDEAFPVAELVDGDLVEGLTVTRGTVPESFSGEVLGVIDDGIAVDLDMVMVELDMPEFASTHGIWQGMSGSPVYADDGRLIGAVAYGLSWGPSPIAGVTPYEEMDNYLATAPAGPIAVDHRTARTIARETDVTVAQAEQGFTQLRMPLGVSGLSSKRLAEAAGVSKPYAPKEAYSIGRSSAAEAGPETIVAGGNLAASVAYGDVTMAGVGTATSVCDDEVVGFGHPMTFRGPTTMSLHPAHALFIQPESLGAPFKVANLGEPAGAITQDRLAGITGALGDPPDSADVSSTVEYDGRSRLGTTHVTVPAYTADALFGQFLSNHDRVLDGILAGTSVQEWTISGLRPNGAEFTLSYADRYTSSHDITWESIFDLADLVWSLSSIPGVTVSSVDVDSDVTDEAGVWRLSSVEQRRAGEWTKLTRKIPAVVRAGKTLRLRTVLTGPDGTTTLPTDFAVPRRARKARTLLLSVAGGRSLHDDGWVQSVSEAEQALGSAVRNDEVKVEFGTPDAITGGDYYGEDEFELGRARYSFAKSRLYGPLDKVVEGSKLLQVRVR